MRGRERSVGKGMQREMRFLPHNLTWPGGWHCSTQPDVSLGEVAGGDKEENHKMGRGR